MSGQRITCDPVTKMPNELLRINLDMTLYGLDTNELLTGTPVVTEVTTSDFTIAHIQVNTQPFINRRGKTVETGKGIQFTVEDGDAGGGLDGQGNYQLKVGCGTDGNPAQFLGVIAPICVSDND